MSITHFTGQPSAQEGNGLQLIKALTIGAIAAGAVPTAHAQQNGPAAQTFDAGKDDYDSHCAACHGSNGAGEGRYALLPTLTIPNLTTLSKRNRGVFPYLQVYEFIDGKVGATGPWQARYAHLGPRV